MEAKGRKALSSNTATASFQALQATTRRWHRARIRRRARPFLIGIRNSYTALGERIPGTIPGILIFIKNAPGIRGALLKRGELELLHEAERFPCEIFLPLTLRTAW